VTTIYNEINIQAPIEKIWEALSNIEELDKYDPTVKKSIAISANKSGVGAKRKVDMRDGKNWFEEQCTICDSEEALAYELTNCSFPVHQLRHSYSFEKKENGIKVVQIMEYRMKFGLLGKIMDTLMVRKRSDKGIKQFLAGLKVYAEKK